MSPTSGPRPPSVLPPSSGGAQVGLRRARGRQTLGKASGRGQAPTLPLLGLALPPGHKSAWTEIISRINLALNSSPENVSTKFSPRRAKQN